MVAVVVSAVKGMIGDRGPQTTVAPVMIAITACETRRHFYVMKGGEGVAIVIIWHIEILI